MTSWRLYGRARKENIINGASKSDCSPGLAAEVWAQSRSVSGIRLCHRSYLRPMEESILNFTSGRAHFEGDTYQRSIPYIDVPLPARLRITLGALTSRSLKRVETLLPFPTMAKVSGFFYTSWHNLLADQCSNASTSASQQSLRDSASAAILQCQVVLALDVRRLYRSDESD